MNFVDTTSDSILSPPIQTKAQIVEEKDQEQEQGSFKNSLSEFVYKRTYSRWNGERRETWLETVERYINFLRQERPQVPPHIYDEAKEYILNLNVMGSMRALWSAGDPAKRDNTCMYNCSFLPVDNLRSFSEALYILMQGTGVGFSVETEFIGVLPVVEGITGEEVTYEVEDSAEGWAEALYFGLVSNYKGVAVKFDLSKVRPAGSVLKTKGGRASGPEPLKSLLDFTQETIFAASGRQLSSLECHDIMCMVGEIVVAGGVRRSALISFSDPEDEVMRGAKDWRKGFPSIRYMANNSAYYAEKPSKDLFDREWNALKNSGSGERGFSIGNWDKRSDRKTKDIRSNPCHEIGLRFLRSVDPWTGEGGGGQFCNLTAAIMRPDDDMTSFAKKIRMAAWLGCIQASFIKFPYLRDGWRQTCDEDRLCGVDITGQCDNPTLSQDDFAMLFFNQVAIETSEYASQILGINSPVAITCGKPSGNTSQLVDCASGFHPRYAQYYYRHVRIAAHDPLCSLIRDQGVPMFKDNGEEDKEDSEVKTWVVRFPVKAPDGAMLRNQETAIEQCERYLKIMKTWCSEKGHNQSVTISVKEEEWDLVGEWVYQNFDDITGLSFLPYDGGKYRLAPYQEISKEEYDLAMSKMPKINFSALSLYERQDRGEGAREFACVGGVCEL